MKEVLKTIALWIVHIIGLCVLYLVTGFGVAFLHAANISYENSVCCIYGFIIGLICNRYIIWRNNEK